MERARSHIRYYTMGEEAEHARFLRSDERLRAFFAQLDELRARRDALSQELTRFPNNVPQV